MLNPARTAPAQYRSVIAVALLGLSLASISDIANAASEMENLQVAALERAMTAERQSDLPAALLDYGIAYFLAEEGQIDPQIYRGIGRIYERLSYRDRTKLKRLLDIYGER